MSPEMRSSGWFCLRIRIAASFISDVNTHSDLQPDFFAASSNPIRMPPMPANKSMNLTVVSIVVNYQKCISEKFCAKIQKFFVCQSLRLDITGGFYGGDVQPYAKKADNSIF